jgi:hypothetical protein
LRLPKDIKDYKVILMDATVATGAAAMMAIRVLLDHEVKEENIMIVSLLMAEIGMFASPSVFLHQLINDFFPQEFILLPTLSLRCKLSLLLLILRSTRSFTSCLELAILETDTLAPNPHFSRISSRLVLLLSGCVIFLI